MSKSLREAEAPNQQWEATLDAQRELEPRRGSAAIVDRGTLIGRSLLTILSGEEKMTEAMNQAARALSATETSELIGDDLRAFADGGPNRGTEDIELGRTAGLDVEMISARWDEAEG